MPAGWLSVAEVAGLLSRTPRTVRRMCEEGRLPGAVVVDGRWRVPSSSVALPGVDPLPGQVVPVKGRDVELASAFRDLIERWVPQLREADRAVARAEADRDIAQQRRDSEAARADAAETVAALEREAKEREVAEVERLRAELAEERARADRPRRREVDTSAQGPAPSWSPRARRRWWWPGG